MSRSVRSHETGRELGRELRRAFEGRPLAAVLVYASLEHDQATLLAGLNAELGQGPKLIGCSTQGLMARGTSVEGGYFAGALGLGGDLSAASARADEIQLETRAKGRALGDALLAQVNDPKLVLVFFDPLSGADVTELLAGLGERVRCPVSGGAASQPWGPMVTTYQYLGASVFSHGAVALALDGPFSLEVLATHGTEPVGLEHVVTSAQANRILELDGRRAADVWKETLGASSTEVSQMAMLAIGLANDGDPELGAYRVLSPTHVDEATGSIGLLSAVKPGTRVTLHHRTRESVFQGTRAMGATLAERLRGRTLIVALGFECGARAEPFLGREATRAENLELQATAAPHGDWFGMLCWGEVLPLKSGPVVANYTFPVVCLLAG